MSPTPSELTRQLRGAGYFIAIATIFVQCAEVVLRSYPFRLQSPAWRISFVSGSTSIVLSVLLMTFVLIAIAIFAGDRPLQFVFSGFAVLGAFCFFVLTAAFILDALQLRNQVQMAVARRYDVTTLWELTRALMGVAGFTLLSMAGLKNAIAIGRQTARQTGKRGTLIGGNMPTSGPGVGESAGVKGA